MSFASIVLVASVVVALTSAVHAAVGFGMNLLAVPVLVVLDAALVPGPAIAAGLLLSVLVLARERAPVDLGLRWAVIGLLPGTLAAVLLLEVVPKSRLAIPMGLMVLVAVAVSVSRLRLSPTPTTLTLAGGASGFLSTAGSIGGPPLALVYAESRGPKVRANLAGFFIVTAVVSLVALALSGHFGGREVQLSVLLVPGVLLGWAVSGPLRPWVDKGHTRSAILGLSALAAVGAIVEGILH